MDLELQARMGRHTWATRAEDGARIVFRTLESERRPTLERLRDARLPFVPRIYEVAEFGATTVQVVEEWIVGSSLDTISSAFAGDEVRCRQLLAILAQQVALLHEAGLWHLDLKPQNTVVCPGRQALYLVDFEFAQPATDGVQECLGFTPLYASAEAVEHGVVCATTDVRALGLTVAELYLGHHPMASRIRDGDDMGTARAVAETEICFNNGTPLLGLVETMCRIEPEDRPSIVEVANWSCQVE